MRNVPRSRSDSAWLAVAARPGGRRLRVQRRRPTGRGWYRRPPRRRPPAQRRRRRSPAAAGGAVTLVTHDSFNVDKTVLADFEQVQRHHRHPARPGRRRRDDQQAGADQGQPARRRGLRHRQHLRLPRRSTPASSPVRARRLAAERRRPVLRSATTGSPPSTTATSASTSTTPGSPPRNSPSRRPSRTWRSPSTRTCWSSSRRPPRHRAGLPARHHRRTSAPTAGRTTGSS